MADRNARQKPSLFLSATIVCNLYLKNILMENYFKKHLIMLIVFMLLSGGFGMLILSRLAIILIENGVDFESANRIAQDFSTYQIYFFNLIFSIIIFFDMRKLKLMSWSTLILTFFVKWIGVLFFLIGYNNEVNNKNIQ